MRGLEAQCSICSDSFNDERDISAVKCGHVFHAVCLNTWLKQKKNCPKCREKATENAVVAKLFFDYADPRNASCTEAGSGVPAAELNQLKADLEAARSKLTLRSREADKLSAENNSFIDKVSQLTESHRALEALHRQEVDNSKLLRQQLSTAQSLARQAAAAREEAATVRQKLTQLQNVQTVINGSQDEIDDLMRQTNDAGQLAIWCTVYKAELTRKRTECRSLSDNMRQCRRELDAMRSTLNTRNTELAAANSKITALEEDVAAQNREMSALRKKLDALTAALGSPSDTAAGLARRLVNESPAPAFTTPRLPVPRGPLKEIDLDTSADLFSPEVTSNPPRKRIRHESASAATSFHLSSAAVKQPISQSASDIRSVGLGALDPTRKKLLLGGTSVPQSVLSRSSVFREGYNGLGGHEKVVVPSVRLHSSTAQTKFSKPNIQSKKFHFLGPSKTAKTPQLPSLSNFMPRSEIDY